MTLYELTSDYLNLLELAEDPDIDEQAFMDTLEGIEGALEDKADGYAKVMRMLDGDAVTIKAEEDRLSTRRKTIENRIKRMKQSLQGMMELTGKTKFKTQLFSFNVQNNPASVVMDESDVANIPERFLKYKDPEIDRKAIKDAIKAGDEDAMDIAHLEQTRGLRIK
jgi:predicted DNA-binding protein YlxM (UPF0122 family)